MCKYLNIEYMKVYHSELNDQKNLFSYFFCDAVVLNIQSVLKRMVQFQSIIQSVLQTMALPA